MNFHHLITFAAFLLLFSFCHDVFAKGYCIEGYEKPDWAIKFANDDFGNTRLHVIHERGSSEPAAKRAALQSVISNQNMAVGGNVTISPNGEILVNGHSLDIRARIVDQCTERGEDNWITMHLLVQTAYNPNNDYEQASAKSEYTFKELSGRVFVPGMAQIYKGQNVKGALFITGEILFIGGIAASFGMQSHYKKKAQDPELDERYYNNKASYAGYAGWAFVGAAAALYIANIIDGAVSDGKRSVFVNGKKIAFVPYTAPKSVGLAMNVNF